MSQLLENLDLGEEKVTPRKGTELPKKVDDTSINNLVDEMEEAVKGKLPEIKE